MSSDNYNFDDFSPMPYDGDNTSGNKESSTSKSDHSLNKAPMKRVRKQKKSFNFVKKAAIIAAVFTVILCIGAAVTVFTLPKNVVYDGIVCAGKDFGNMTYEQALSALQNEIKVDIPLISVNVNGNIHTINQNDIELSPLIEETAKKVYNFGKSDSKLKNTFNAVRLKFKKIDILPVTTLNEEKLKEEFIKIGNAELGERKPYSAVASDMTHAQIIPGVRGFDTDTDTAIAQFKAAIAHDNYTNIPITLNSSDPVPITAEQVMQAINLPATDAKYTLQNGSISIVPEKSGRYITPEDCAAALSAVKLNGDPVDLPCYPSNPEKTAAVLKEKLFNCVLGTYTTHYAAGGNRGANVANAASRINETIVLPNDTFSFNKTVGRRSAANGFKPAPEYQNGTSVTGIGGGTCQVSTTLYSAILYSDLQIVSRRNHSMSVGYAPLGQDATVSDGGIDFKFLNDSGYPIKISATTSGGAITVKILGTEPDVKKTVKITHTGVPSATGKSVKTTRTVYDDSGNILKTDNLGISKYKPHG